VFRVRQQAVALKKAVGPDNYQHVIDAIEADNLGGLAPELRRPAKFLQDQFKYTLRRQRQAGIPRTHELVVNDLAPTEARGYFPHARSQSLAEGKGFQGGGARQIRVDANRARLHREPLSTLRQTQPGLFSEDLPVVYANRLAATVKAVHKGELNRRLADLGRPAKAGGKLGENEQIFHLRGSDLSPVDRIPEKATSGRYVVLDKRLVESAHTRFAAQPKGEGIIRGYDVAQAGFKRVATATPGFHIRNLFGDLQNAYLGQPGHQLAANLRHAGRALALLSRHESQLPKKLHPELAPSTKGVKIGGDLVTYDKLVSEAQRVGALRAGFIAREIPEQARGGMRPMRGPLKGARQRAGRVGQFANRQMQNREDLARLTTYIGARQRGLDPERAAAEVAKYHFDYGDLTPFERNVARRFFPFYTFSARNIPLQAKALVTRPGKYANFEKLREEAAQQAGLAPGYEQNLSEYDQRNLGVPIRIGGHTSSLGLSLPLTDINEIPTTLNPAGLGREYGQRTTSLLTPLLKNPIEYATNYSFFFRRAIENKDAPLVPAPKWVAGLPPKLRAQMGIVPDFVDKRSGKKTWGWPGKTAYLARTLPGLPSLAQTLTTTGSRVDQTAAEKAIGVAGVRAAPLDATARNTSDLNALYKTRDQLNRERAIFNQRGIKADNATPAYQRLSDRLKAVNAQIIQLRTKRGDKILPGPRKSTNPAAALAQEYGVGTSTSPQDLAKEFGLK
jgi:hypothetical protein